MRKFAAVALSALVLTGCDTRPKVDDGDGAKTKTTTGETAPKKSPTGPKPVERTSMVGTWVFERNQQITQQGHFGWLPMFLLKISKSDSGKYAPELLPPPPQMKVWRIAKSDIGEKTAHLVLSQEGKQLDIQVSLKTTEALGNVQSAPSALRWPVPARLLATTESDLKAFFPPVPHKHFQDLDQAMDRFMKQDEPDAVDAFIKKHPRNPLSYFAIYVRNPLLKVRTPDAPRPDPKDIRAQLKRLDGLAAVWGRRAALLSKLELAHNLVQWRPRGTRLIRKDVNLDIASEIVEGVESSKSQRLLNEAQQAQLADLRKYIELEQNVVAVLTTRDQKRRTSAIAYLDDFLKTAPTYVPWQLYAVAEGNRLAGNVDKAVEQHARLLAMPSATGDLEREFEARWQKMPDLQKRLKELWAKKTGGKAGVDDYLAETYRHVMKDLLPAVVATRPAPDRKRTHLCELFTSCDDRFCVGADVASQIIQRTYKPVDVVVLRYHLDVPQPNPLVCNDSKLRAFDCQIPSAPMILINGKPLASQMTSTMAGVPLWTALVRNAVHSDSAADAPQYRIAVSAAARSGVLTIKVEVDGPEKADPDMRLRLVLAEDRISYTGKNGIRHHDMVVRSMPGGIDGVPLKEEKTTMTRTVNLSDLSSRLRDFLTSLEEKTNAKLSVKPVGFRKLHVVAFVQSTKGRREVLQVAQTVVDGLDARSAPAAKKTAKPKTNGESP
jgi:hypothetical protein